MTLTRQRLGRLGENYATRYLRDRGWLILDRNWRCRDGEIDIVGLDHGQIVICEVRTRSGSGAGTAVESVTPLKVRKLRHLAVRWLQGRGVRGRGVRIDVIGIQLDPAGRPQVTHLRGIE
ncbi:MAG: YraN family protein [Candidatus Nanopelagicales bacterium]